MADQKSGKGSRFILYVVVVVLAAGGFFAYRLYDMHKRNVETGNQMQRMADRMAKMNGQ
jgi:flagellar basal body-associated protein FliL